MSLPLWSLISSIYLRFVRPNVKMFPEPSSLLPVTPWIIVSDLPGKAAQIFSYCTFSSPLLLALLHPYYGIQGPEFYSEFFEVRNS